MAGAVLLEDTYHSIGCNVAALHPPVAGTNLPATTRLSRRRTALRCVAAPQPARPPMPDPTNPRRLAMGAAKRFLLTGADEVPETADDRPPRLTPSALSQTRMSRSRDRILANLDDMYREAFERAKASGDAAQMASLDFAYRREQLYFEILLDVRDAVERR